MREDLKGISSLYCSSPRSCLWEVWKFEAPLQEIYFGKNTLEDFRGQEEAVSGLFP